MRQPGSGWKFSVAVLLPVVAAVLVTIGLAGCFILWSAQRTDERAIERQQSLVAHFVEGAKLDIADAQGTVVLRYEATEAFLDDEVDMEWVVDEFGEVEYWDFGHERVYVLDPSFRPVFAASLGEPVDISGYKADQAVVDPLAQRLRAPEIVQQIAAYEAGNSDWPPQMSDVVTIGGRVAFATIMPIVSDWEDQEQEPGSHYFHVAIDYLDGEIAEDMMQQYRIEGAHFDTLPNTVPGETMVPVANAAGRFVAYFKWKPERPGEALLAETLPASLGLVAVIGLVIAVLLFGLARSMQALEKARAEALHRATHDPLTGLANRALFNERLERSPLPLALLALDLDRFKAVNDTLGHEAGDELLRQVAGRLTALVGTGDTVARLGGDEFMILLSGDADTAVLASLAAGIVEAIGRPFPIHGQAVEIGVSVGIATALTDERKELVSRADFALYDAKESGRNTFRVFDELRKAA